MRRFMQRVRGVWTLMRGGSTKKQLSVSSFQLHLTDDETHTITIRPLNQSSTGSQMRTSGRMTHPSMWKRESQCSENVT
jgi:hypothetical protein